MKIEEKSEACKWDLTETLQRHDLTQVKTLEELPENQFANIAPTKT